MKRIIIDGIDFTPLPWYLRKWVDLKTWWWKVRRRPFKFWLYLFKRRLG